MAAKNTAEVTSCSLQIIVLFGSCTQLVHCGLVFHIEVYDSEKKLPRSVGISEIVCSWLH